MREFTVNDYMIKYPPSVKRSTPIGKVIGLLEASHISGIPVVDDFGSVIGFVSEKDCIHKLLHDSYHCDTTAMAEDVMNKSPETVRPGDTIYDVAAQMDKLNRKAYPVVEDEQLVGLLTRTAVLRALNDYMQVCSLPHP